VRVLETTLEIGPDGRAVLQLPEGLGPGRFRAVVVLEGPAEAPEPAPGPAAPEPLAFPTVPVAGWTTPSSTRREDLYGERGR
jgi:hypothetical protein